MRPDTDYDAAYGASSNAIYELILLFDGRDDSGALRALAELASYRLDRAPGEIFSCAIKGIRAGKRRMVCATSSLPDILWHARVSITR